MQGVPVAVKDIIDVAGHADALRLADLRGEPRRASRSAECVEALERAGAIVLGKSVTTEFAYYTPGKTRNPWNAAHTPGGSSMGSAASVACGMAAGALGTQTNGSVIRPAAFCGVVGFKPSFGAVSNHGTLDPWPTLDHTGVFARDVADAALLASVIALPAASVTRQRAPACRARRGSRSCAPRCGDLADSAQQSAAGIERVEARVTPARRSSTSSCRRDSTMRTACTE